jgi:hypothetical protein
VHARGTLTRLSFAAKLRTGANLLLRRITTCAVLVALFGIYAAPLAAAFSTDTMDCCSAGMCPRPGRSLAHHQMAALQQTHEEMADCGMGSQSGSMRKCEMGACETQKDNVLQVGLFVLSAPMRVLRRSVQAPVLALAPQTEHSVSQIPATPPPRRFLS